MKLKYGQKVWVLANVIRDWQDGDVQLEVPDSARYTTHVIVKKSDIRTGKK